MQCVGMVTLENEIKLDVRGMACPAPMRALRRVLRESPQVMVIDLVGDDPHLELDVAAFCARSPHHLLAVTRTGSTIHLRVHR